MSYITSEFIRPWGQQKNHNDEHYHHNDHNDQQQQPHHHHDHHQPSLGYMWVCQARRTAASVQSRSYHCLFFFSNRPLFIIIIIIIISSSLIIIIVNAIIIIEILSLPLLNLIYLLFWFWIWYVGLFGRSFFDLFSYWGSSPTRRNQAFLGQMTTVK